jgi:hypothetical protein
MRLKNKEKLLQSSQNFATSRSSKLQPLSHSPDRHSNLQAQDQRPLDLVNPLSIDNLKAIKALRRTQAQILQNTARDKKYPKTHQETVNDDLFAGRMTQRARENDKYYQGFEAKDGEESSKETAVEKEAGSKRAVYVAPRTSVEVKLEESTFRKNQKVRQRYLQLMKKTHGIEDDYYEVQGKLEAQKQLRLQERK